MEFSNITIGIIVIIVIIAIIIYLNKEKFKKEFMDNITFSENEGNMNDLVNNKLDTAPMESVVSVSGDLDINWKNASNGKYKAASYLDGERGNTARYDSQDSYETQLAENVDYANKTQNDKFVPSDNGNGNYAKYNQEQKDFSVKELMDVDKLLPKEENADWFDTVPEPIKVRNRHLININRPIGVDTVGSSMKNACRDLRGNIPAPKFAISPFLNSSIEPDIATVGFCNTNPYK